MKGISDYLDVIVEPRYDTVMIPAAGATLLTFFALPKGQGVSAWQTAAGVQAKTYADTNMDLAGQLPGGYNFKLLGFRVMPAWDMTDNDLHFVINPLVFTFLIGSKPFLTVPLRTIPQGNGPFGTGASMNNLGYPVLGNSYSIAKKPLDLLQTQNFQVTITAPSGQLTPSTTTKGGMVGAGQVGLALTVFLDGFLYRPVQ
jgi:hypothetical protein